MKPAYLKKQVQPVTAKLDGSGTINVTYKVFPESSHFSSGVDFHSADGKISIVIDRCKIGEPCEPMAKSVLPLDGRWQAEVHVPYHGEKVVVVHADGEEQIYPAP